VYQFNNPIDINGDEKIDTALGEIFCNKNFSCADEDDIDVEPIA